MEQAELFLMETCLRMLEQQDWYIITAEKQDDFRVKLVFLPYGVNCQRHLQATFVIEITVLKDWCWKRWRWNETIPPTIRQFL